MDELAIVDRGCPSGAFWAHVLRSAWTTTMSRTPSARSPSPMGPVFGVIVLGSRLPRYDLERFGEVRPAVGAPTKHRARRGSTQLRGRWLARSTGNPSSGCRAGK